jgi:small subunit ribosomal protein S6
MATKMNQYEALFLLGPVGATEPEKALGLCRGVIERHGGQVLVIKKWDERKLAYELAGQRRGTYIIAFFRAPGDAIAPMERDVKLSEEMLRVLITRADHLNEQEMAAVEPQPVVREERPSYERPPMEAAVERPTRPLRSPRREEAADAGKE